MTNKDRLIKGLLVIAAFAVAFGIIYFIFN